jgi:glycosyltransferase involved in cell wall biosynthesis
LTKRICVVTTTPFIANAFLRPHFLALKSRYDVTLAINTRDGYPLDAEVAAAAAVVHVPMERKVSLVCDIAALWGLWRLFRRCRFDLVHTFAPKAGLLGMLAAFAAGVHVRLHSFQGEVWASRTRVAGALLKALDRLVGALATHRLVVSHGEQAFLEAEGVLVPGGSTILGSGSIAGVDVNLFRPDAEARQQVRSALGIGSNDVIIMYLGRIARDKGVLDLAKAFTSMASANAWLVFVGPDEDGLRPALEAQCGVALERLRLVPYTRTPAQYLASADIVCLPTYREGFPAVLLEAGACGIPVVASRVYGTKDAVVEGVTGLVHEPGNIEDIERALSLLLSDPALRVRMGKAGRQRVQAEFRTERLVAALLDYYAVALSK